MVACMVLMSLRIWSLKAGAVVGPSRVTVMFRWRPVSDVKGRGGQAPRCEAVRFDSLVI